MSASRLPASLAWTSLASTAGSPSSRAWWPALPHTLIFGHRHQRSNSGCGPPVSRPEGGAARARFTPRRKHVEPVPGSSEGSRARRIIPARQSRTTSSTLHQTVEDQPIGFDAARRAVAFLTVAAPGTLTLAAVRLRPFHQESVSSGAGMRPLSTRGVVARTSHALPSSGRNSVSDSVRAEDSPPDTASAPVVRVTDRDAQFLRGGIEYPLSPRPRPRRGTPTSTSRPGTIIVDDAFVSQISFTSRDPIGQRMRQAAIGLRG